MKTAARYTHTRAHTPRTLAKLAQALPVCYTSRPNQRNSETQEKEQVLGRLNLGNVAIARWHHTSELFLSVCTALSHPENNTKGQNEQDAQMGQKRKPAHLQRQRKSCQERKDAGLYQKRKQDKEQ
jgi:hypothetical protein